MPAHAGIRVFLFLSTNRKTSITGASPVMTKEEEKANDVFQNESSTPSVS